jgi:large subunit ribosomal protein L2
MATLPSVTGLLILILTLTSAFLFFRGGGHRRRYRLIDFKRTVQGDCDKDLLCHHNLTFLLDEPGVVQRLEYDPNRSAHIALVKYPGDRLCYILSCQGLNPGDTVTASRTMELEIKPGNAMPLGSVPIGTQVHNLEFLPGKGGQICRSAGTHATILDKVSKPNHVLLQLASREKRYFRAECLATIGVISNPLHRLRVLGKAGRTRHLGRRPHVRGKAMNPVDHPMGGGEGHGGGHKSQSPWGTLAKGFKTRRSLFVV